MHWKYGKASVAGTSHAFLNTPCQDAHECSIIPTPLEEIIIAVVCDGAGSAPHSDTGAQTMSSNFAMQAEAFVLANGLEGLSPELMTEWIVAARGKLEAMAEEQGLALKDYACTFLAAIVSPNQGHFAQIGDGGIVVSDIEAPNEYMWIFWPQKGQYFNTTNFVTDNDFQKNLQFDGTDKMLRDIALFSDGIENIAFKYETNEAYGPFFRGLFGALRINPDHENFDNEVARFLGSEKVNERTDDDKTLIIVSLIGDNSIIAD
jgi:hypothetical protein